MFQRNPNAILMSYSKLKANDAAALRRKLRDSKCSYRVVKNTIAKLAAKGTNMEAMSKHFRGSTAVAYHENDPIGLAKVFSEFGRTVKVFVFKAVMVEGREYAGDSLEAVASLPSKHQLVGQVAALLNQPLTSLARVLRAPLRDLASVLKEITKEA